MVKFIANIREKKSEKRVCFATLITTVFFLDKLLREQDTLLPQYNIHVLSNLIWTMGHSVSGYQPPLKNTTPLFLARPP